VQASVRPELTLVFKVDRNPSARVTRKRELEVTSAFGVAGVCSRQTHCKGCSHGEARDGPLEALFYFHVSIPSVITTTNQHLSTAGPG
jgi:hypothetical protein